MEPKACLLVFAACMAALALKAHWSQVFVAQTPGGLPQEASVVSVSGIVYRYPGGGASLCMAGCAKLYGSVAPNASKATVMGVWSGRDDGSITVVRESWTR